MIELHNTTSHSTPVDEETMFGWIRSCLPEGLVLGEVGIVLQSDEEILEMNKEHLDHHYYTDILTFDYSEEENTLEGELYISFDRVIDNAQENNVTTEKEFLRVVAHGFLHLLGMNDDSPELKAAMRSKEDEWIDAFYSVSRGTNKT